MAVRLRLLTRSVYFLDRNARTTRGTHISRHSTRAGRGRAVGQPCSCAQGRQRSAHGLLRSCGSDHLRLDVPLRLHLLQLCGSGLMRCLLLLGCGLLALLVCCWPKTGPLAILWSRRAELRIKCRELRMGDDFAKRGRCAVSAVVISSHRKCGEELKACCDWMTQPFGKIATHPADQKMAPPVPQPSFVRVLAFWGAGWAYAVPNGRKVLLLNELGASVFLAIYDRSLARHRNSPSTASWFRLVQFSVEYPEPVKSRYVANELVFNRRFAVQTLRRFSHVWVFDENVDFPPLSNVRSFILTSAEMGALIAQPAVSGTAWPQLHPQTKNGCFARWTDFVEIMMPLLQTRVALDVFEHLLLPQARTDWGVDQVWCRWVARRYGVNSTRACAVIDSGPFAKRVSHTAGYSRGIGEVELGCMNKIHARLLSSVAPGVVHKLPIGTAKEDMCYTNISHVLPSKGAGPHRSKLYSSLRLYVYDLSSVKGGPRCSTSARKGVGSAQDNFQWESHLEGSLRKVLRLTSDPSTADVFLLPACLSQEWSRYWHFTRVLQWQGPEKGKIVPFPNITCIKCLDSFEEQLLRTMRTVGPWFDTQPEKHLVMRHLCPILSEADTEPLPWWTLVGGTRSIFGSLWQHPRVRYACIEHIQPAQQWEFGYPLPAVGIKQKFWRPSVMSWAFLSRDVNRELHVPYYTSAVTALSPPGHAERTRDFGFAGTMCCDRSWLTRELVIGDLLLGPNRSSGFLGQHDMLIAFLRSARFVVHPHGDTQERLNIYQALHSGTPVALPSHVIPPLGMMSWGRAAVDASAAPLGTERAFDMLSWTSEQRRRTLTRPWWPRPPKPPPATLRTRAMRHALQHYSEWMQGFEEARAPFLWGSDAFNAQLIRALEVLFLPRPHRLHHQHRWEGLHRNATGQRLMKSRSRSKRSGQHKLQHMRPQNVRITQEQ